MTAIKDAVDLFTLKSSGAITTLDQMTSLMTDGGAVAGEPIYVHKEARVAGAAATAAVGGMPVSCWQFEGATLPHGAVPTTWANPTNATVGGIGQANPGGGRTKYNLSILGSCNTAGMLIIYDRLGHMAGLDGTVTTAQNINGGSPAAPTRNTGGVGNMMFVEIYTALGATATTITASYTNTSATAGQITQPVVIGGTNRNEAQRMIALSLASGDKGVQAVTSVTLAASTLTAGSFGITLVRVLACIPFSTVGGCSLVVDFLNANMPTFDTNACIAMMFVPTTTQLPNLDIMFNNVEV